MARRNKAPLRVRQHRVAVLLTESELRALDEVRSVKTRLTRSQAMRAALRLFCREAHVAPGLAASTIRRIASPWACGACGSKRTVEAGRTPEGIIWVRCAGCVEKAAT